MMIVFTTKLTRRKIVSALLALCIIICSAFVVMHDGAGADTVSVSEEQTPIHEGKKLKTNEERVALLNEYGWTVDNEPLEFMEVKIPEVFDGAYSEYNEIQKRQGMDLSDYSGKRVMRYTYKINNHPSNEEGVVANIIVYKNKLIGGDVCSPKLGGFMHGLSETSETVEQTTPDTTEKNEEPQE
ncbi:MAG: DUF4830 domain-containing protein [Oscillospiraceae bacterium]|nr:DUF4830 domain-containing protein [Oscillospiraceae bacterium]